MSKAVGYSLWLVPSKGAHGYRMLDECIRNLALAKGSPEFVPHVTLLGQFMGPDEELILKTRKFCGRFSALEIELHGLRSHRNYFMALHAEIREGDLLIAHRFACNILAPLAPPDRNFRSHLSLAYGEFSSEEANEIHALVLEKWPEIVSLKLRFDSVELWHTEGPAGNWHKICSVPFSG